MDGPGSARPAACERGGLNDESGTAAKDTTSIGSGDRVSGADRMEVEVHSMGNFCYGGNTNPDDKDSVIVQARYAWNAETGKAERTDLSVIPCLISSTENLNDYCPHPCAEGSEAYTRILKRLEWTGQ